MQSVKFLSILALAAAPLSAQVTATAAAPKPGATTVKPFSSTDSARFTTLGKRARDFMLTAKPDSLIAMMSPEDAAALGGVDGANKNISTLQDRGGRVLKVLAEKLTRRNGLPQFWYEANFELFADEPLVMRFVFSEEGKLVGLGMGPKSTAKFDN